MTTEIKTPTFPESIADGTVAAWHKAVGEPVRRDEVLVDIETDKVVIEVPAPANGQLVEILKQEGDVVVSEEPLATFEEGAPAPAPVPPSSAPEAEEVEVGTSPAARKLA
ncbi:MAG: dihydrolipoamide succinyltransferase, partial [Gammaproteobacteria bacterium]|nr:dihydrolipoamide succinyltransferase [Gammaproteobacteria bacterium]